MTTHQIPLSRGLNAIVSAEDFERLSIHRWHAVPARHTHYAARRASSGVIYMHREIMGVVDQGRSVFVDHINHEGLDNTRQNLRTCTQSQNARNRRDKKTYLKTLGAAFENGAWVARISQEGRQIYLGRYPTEREAGIAYEAALVIVLNGFSCGAKK